MAKALNEFGIDFRFIGFAYLVTVFSVLIFSFGVPLIIFVKTLVTNGNRLGQVVDNMGVGGMILLIPSTIFAVKALPFTFPASLVGWALAFRIATTFGCPRYAAAMIAGLSAAIFSSFTFGYWFELVLTSRSSHDLNPSILVLPSTLLAALLVSALVYRPQKATF